MANSYFDFKKFRIEQANCANKVSTDACVFGAWLNEYIDSGSILDIGCGSGLLSLMLADNPQRQITGIELEKNCAFQAIENVNASPWANQVEIIQKDARIWNAAKKFDYIISNPPFFNNTSKNPDKLKNIARQVETLGPKDWDNILETASSPQTTLILLLSNNDVLSSYKKHLVRLGFQNQQVVELLDKESSEVKRVILLASQGSLPLQKEFNLHYKNPDGTYSNRFKQLLKDYYLHL